MAAVRYPTKIDTAAKADTLMPIVRQQENHLQGLFIETQGHTENALDISEFKHYLINHSKLFAK